MPIFQHPAIDEHQGGTHPIVAHVARQIRPPDRIRDSRTDEMNIVATENPSRFHAVMNNCPPEILSLYVARLSFTADAAEDIITMGELLQGDAEALERLPDRAEQLRPEETFLPWAIVGIYRTRDEAVEALRLRKSRLSRG